MPDAERAAGATGGDRPTQTPAGDGATGTTGAAGPTGTTAGDLAPGLAAAAAGVAAATGRRAVVLIDGRSGTGKTTLGAQVAEQLGAQLVHLDDLYPGWDGLRAAADAVVTDVLGAPSGYRRWDWAADAPADWTSVDPDLPIVVEGCGALSRASAPLASLRVWLEADDAVRWDRAIGRDGEVFAREWDRWAAQEQAFIAAEDPAALADVVLRT
ncbi:ATP-binding protein [Curtobacterium flaccumfaciens pv. flaccumfaciens]|uniref:ATP-binding protein n=1 Tax=Curtobacterium flaccumfaciens TaxID=2035 RepID=UPI00217E49A2|nr:ATP-binding protein [Curtobacterium flaccumfaciens]MCS6570278.1 ATP-binding protein [Curtobacterium flaccumfaciens pv. flaccumfaciens]MCS6585134.1 ATP-binding protein [Curtobacterium flaccumfaciens pv. flaccumfaciens]